MSIDKITRRSNQVPTRLPRRVQAEKVNEIIDYINGLVAGQSTSTSQYTYYTNPLTGKKVRVGNRGDDLVMDKELVLNGFAQDLGGGEGENVGWESIGGAI